ncbi:MBL fold metallo-hydrolase [Polycladidibacter hongkongensis]|uniref:MBL fold metallo-hydrolase n=1 Tax=Polycladidibacter hongkongensis TaxID=1647556 RepID=UPI00082E9281|nr:MBL fold metallo-hydrolase [Pseudovibrio hongkongensis]
MDTQLNITILGCGSSTGVPRIGGDWGNCDPQEPKNRRRRCALLVERHGPQGTTTLLVDTGPDIREQLLAANTQHIDAVLYTHAHADHVHGIDDLRFFVMVSKRKMPVYMDASTSERMMQAFGYCFETPPGSSYPPIMQEHRLQSGQPLIVEGAGGSIPVLPFLVNHGDIDALGFRFGGLAYSPDLHDIPPESLQLLANLDHWIIDCLREKPHRSHLCLADALAWLERLQVPSATLTNMHADLDYNALRSRLPQHISPAYDGMELLHEFRNYCAESANS